MSDPKYAIYSLSEVLAIFQDNIPSKKSLEILRRLDIDKLIKATNPPIKTTNTIFKSRVELDDTLQELSTYIIPINILCAFNRVKCGMCKKNRNKFFLVFGDKDEYPPVDKTVPVYILKKYMYSMLYYYTLFPRLRKERNCVGTCSEKCSNMYILSNL